MQLVSGDGSRHSSSGMRKGIGEHIYLGNPVKSCNKSLPIEKRGDEDQARKGLFMNFIANDDSLESLQLYISGN